MLESAHLEPSVLFVLHDRSSKHRDEILGGRSAACFYCLTAFEVTSIKDWIDGDQTALCPHCGIDSVLPEAAFDLLEWKDHTRSEILVSMRNYWFGRSTRSVLEDETVGALQHQVHSNACRKGFWDTRDGQRPDISEKLMWATSELSEAFEENRNGNVGRHLFFYEGEGGKPEGFGIELADAIIVILDIAGRLNIDMSRMLRIKVDYNKTRPRLHGKGT